MKINEVLLTKLEKLSMIEIKDEKKEEMIKNLSGIVNFVENLSELDLTNKEASFTTLNGGTPFREDLPSKNPETIKIISKNAPKKEDGFFVVPKIIE